MASTLELDPSTKQVSWKVVPGYGCLPMSHFVVEYKKSSSLTWKTAGYFENRTFDLVNPDKGKKYDVKVYSQNSVGISEKRVRSFWTNSKQTLNKQRLYNNNKNCFQGKNHSNQL